MDERERAIRALMPLVRRIARRVSLLVPSIDYDDMVGDGSIGAIRAVDGYDASFGTTLENYARRLILGAILNGIRRMDPVSERARREMRDAESLRFALAVQRGETPSIAEIEALRPRFAAARRQTHAAVPLSLDRSLPPGYAMPVYAFDDPAEIVDALATREQLRRAIAALPDRQRSVIAQYYFSDRSLREIGNGCAISSQRASQLHRRALRRLRGIVHAAQD